MPAAYAPVSSGGGNSGVFLPPPPPKQVVPSPMSGSTPSAFASLLGGRAPVPTLPAQPPTTAAWLGATGLAAAATAGMASSSTMPPPPPPSAAWSSSSSSSSSSSAAALATLASTAAAAASTASHSSAAAAPTVLPAAQALQRDANGSTFVEYTALGLPAMPPPPPTGFITDAETRQTVYKDVGACKEIGTALGSSVGTVLRILASAIINSVDSSKVSLRVPLSDPLDPRYKAPLLGQDRDVIEAILKGTAYVRFGPYLDLQLPLDAVLKYCAELGDPGSQTPDEHSYSLRRVYNSYRALWVMREAAKADAFKLLPVGNTIKGTTNSTTAWARPMALALYVAWQHFVPGGPDAQACAISVKKAFEDFNKQGRGVGEKRGRGRSSAASRAVGSSSSSSSSSAAASSSAADGARRAKRGRAFSTYLGSADDEGDGDDGDDEYTDDIYDDDEIDGQLDG